MKNDEFLVIPLKHVSGLRVVVNHPGTLKLWAITHETAIICEIYNFFVKIVKHVSGLMVVVIRPETLELWNSS